MVRDRQIEWMRKRLYIPGRDFVITTEAIAEAAGTGSSQNVAHLLGTTPHVVWASESENDGTASDLAFGTHDGTNVKMTIAAAEQKVLVFAAVTPTEYSTFGYGGLELKTAGDIYSTYLRVPFDVDPSYPMGFKVHYVGAKNVADIFDWIVLADFKAINTALAAPATALDTPIDITGTKTAVAHSHDWSSRGIKNKGFLTRSQIEDGAIMVMSVELDSTESTLVTEECHLLGLEIDYVPMKTRGIGNVSDGQLTATGAD